MSYHQHTLPYQLHYQVIYVNTLCNNLLFTFRPEETRCSFATFDCEDKNPCAPTLCTDSVENYPGPSGRKYVNCTGGCSAEQCPRRKVWDQEGQRCVKKTM